MGVVFHAQKEKSMVGLWSLFCECHNLITRLPDLLTEKILWDDLPYYKLIHIIS
jgi:hypothetical protein